MQTKSLTLVPNTLEEIRAQIEALFPADKAHVSAGWLARLREAAVADPWEHGFALRQRETGAVIGTAGFKGPPTDDGIVEIAYGIAPEHQGKGYATEAAHALVDYALASGRVRIVRAHTLPEENASTRVLAKCGFRRVGEVIDPEDGLVWRWEKKNDPARTE
jgi:[ribosomal protein S5]-alanine N-acetyltransferase